MARGVKDPSEVFADVMALARDRLVLEAKDAASFEQRGVRGDERAAALAAFLRDHLPGKFRVTKGEVIDYRDNRTGQLDVIVYDSQTSAPVTKGAENSLIPAEAVYAVIEVKTILNADELHRCFRAAGKLRALSPYKSSLVPARQEGAPGDAKPRCLYNVFAYSTNLGKDNWLQKEHERIVQAAHDEDLQVDSIDRVIVLSRGAILPAFSVGKEEQDDAQSVFLDFYLHLVNFLMREVPRREPVDWQAYAAERSPGWKKLK